MNFSGPLQVTGGQVLSESTVPLYTPGTEGITRDGGRYRYVQAAAAAALVAGNVIQSPAQIVGNQQLVVVSFGVPAAFPQAGTTTVVVTNGATAVTANQYAGGYAIFDTGPGLGGRYVIKSHPAAAGAASLTLTLEVDDALLVTLTTASRVSLQASPYVGVIQLPAVLTGVPVGVAVFPITAGSYGWVQTGGVGAVLIAGTPAAGAVLASPSGTAGAAAIGTAGLVDIGSILVTGIAGKCQAALLNFP